MAVARSKFEMPAPNATQHATTIGSVPRVASRPTSRYRENATAALSENATPAVDATL